ncbi:unnamed protein product [Fraxinus pennsylvanica]|uniref:Uncharacterized protein n=1 Tax=Fraxinus pennsylvanica TaxID=56036 RepID=A0AAD1ZLQ2_9LAMI|nr:unnamed protein product [Fraxinus pennsylvanica]
MERLHLHIQKLQIELADVREKSGSKSDVSSNSQTGSKDASHVGRSNDSQVNGNFTPLENCGSLQHENAETTLSLPSGGNTSMQVKVNNTIAVSISASDLNILGVYLMHES